MKITLFWASMVLCGTAMADLSETTILTTSAALNLETGAVVGSGGDILWDGSTIARRAALRRVTSACWASLILPASRLPISRRKPRLQRQRQLPRSF